MDVKTGPARELPVKISRRIGRGLCVTKEDIGNEVHDVDPKI